jgi:hypothetical protein
VKLYIHTIKIETATRNSPLGSPTCSFWPMYAMWSECSERDDTLEARHFFSLEVVENHLLRFHDWPRPWLYPRSSTISFNPCCGLFCITNTSNDSRSPHLHDSRISAPAVCVLKRPSSFFGKSSMLLCYSYNQHTSLHYCCM